MDCLLNFESKITMKGQEMMQEGRGGGYIFNLYAYDIRGIGCGVFERHYPLILRQKIEKPLLR